MRTFAGQGADIYERLGVMMRDPSVAVQAMQRLGADVYALKERFDCVIPDHEHEAVLYQHLPSQPVYYKELCFEEGPYCGPGETPTLKIPDVYAACLTGRTFEILDNGTRVVWFIRMLDDLGEITLPVVTANLPDCAPAEVQKVYPMIHYLFRCREFYKPKQEGTPLSHRFLAKWCSCSQETVRTALQWLVGNQYLTVFGGYKSAYGKETCLYALATEATNPEINELELVARVRGDVGALCGSPLSRVPEQGGRSQHGGSSSTTSQVVKVGSAESCR